MSERFKTALKVALILAASMNAHGRNRGLWLSGMVGESDGDDDRPSHPGPKCVTVPPLGGGANDGAAITTALVTATAAGHGVCLVTGEEYTINSAITIPSEGLLIGAPGTVLRGTMPLDGSNSHFVLYTPNHSLSPDVSVVSTTLSSAAVEGRPVLITDGPIAVGKWISVAGGSTWQDFKVLATSGSGPYTVTVDEPVSFAFAAGSTVLGIRPTINPRVIGNGMRITGTASRGYEWLDAIEGRIEDVVIDGTWDWGCGSFDLGGRHNRAARVHCTNTVGSLSTVTAGLAMEGQVGSSIVDFSVDQIGGQAYITAGVFVSACSHPVVRDGHVSAASIGVFVDSQLGNVGEFGTSDGLFEHLHVAYAATYGFVVTDRSLRNAFNHCSANHGGSHGFLFTRGENDQPDLTRVANCSAAHNGGVGFLFNYGSVTAANLVAMDNATAGVKVGAGNVALTGYSSARNGVAEIMTYDVGSLFLNQWDVTTSSSAGASGLYAAGYGVVVANDGHIVLGPSGSAIFGIQADQDCTVYLRNLVLQNQGASVARGLAVNQIIGGGTIHYDGSVDVSAATWATVGGAVMTSARWTSLQ